MILWVAFGGGKDYIILWVQTLRNGSLKAKRCTSLDENGNNVPYFLVSRPL